MIISYTTEHLKVLNYCLSYFCMIGYFQQFIFTFIDDNFFFFFSNYNINRLFTPVSNNNLKVYNMQLPK